MTKRIVTYKCKDPKCGAVYFDKGHGVPSKCTARRGCFKCGHTLIKQHEYEDKKVRG